MPNPEAYEALPIVANQVSAGLDLRSEMLTLHFWFHPAGSQSKDGPFRIVLTPGCAQQLVDELGKAIEVTAKQNRQGES